MCSGLQGLGFLDLDELLSEQVPRALAKSVYRAAASTWRLDRVRGQVKKSRTVLRDSGGDRIDNVEHYLVSSALRPGQDQVVLKAFGQRYVAHPCCRVEPRDAVRDNTDGAIPSHA